MKKVNLDSILEQALTEALAGLTARARDMVEQVLEQALAAKVKALLEAPEALAAPIRARAKVTPEAAATPVEAPASKAPRRRKAKATPEAAPVAPALDFGAIEAALAKYAGAHTPRGKPLNEVLARRMRKVLAHAEALGHKDLPGLAHRALAIMAGDPMGAAMGSWKALAERLGLPVHVGSE
jgi:DNA-binding transcriptional regulator YbjK